MEVLPKPGSDQLDPIKRAPGLYVSGGTIGCNPEVLSSEGITHILRILKYNEILSRHEEPSVWRQFQVKEIPIDDDGNEDILVHLDDVYHWVQEALQGPKSQDHSENSAKQTQNRVLIHCRQGVSRSGAFIVGYLMKSQSLPYSSALSLARASRSMITPNKGFEQQLRIYQHCACDIYLSSAPQRPPSPEPVSSPGPEKADRQLHGQVGSNRTPKPAYKAWKRERDAKMAGGEDLGRFTSMASMAAEFGRKRLAAQDQAKQRESEGEGGADARPDGGDGGASNVKRQWQRVEQMERAWNNKLIRGEVERAKEVGDLEDLMNNVFDSVREHQ